MKSKNVEHERLYLNLDHYLPLETMPDIKEAICLSYSLIKQNSWQRTTNLNGDVNKTTWFYKNKNARDNKDFFKIEIIHDALAPMWILNITDAKEEVNIYDSFETPLENWKSIDFRNDIPEQWTPFINWIKSLEIFKLTGRVSIIMARPGVPIQYHRDTGGSCEDFVPHPHRQEFIWLNLSTEKRLYILDEQRNPILVESESAFFNHHFWHGSHEAPLKWCFSVKIEGIFEDQFRAKVGLNQDLYFGRI